MLQELLVPLVPLELSGPQVLRVQLVPLVCRVLQVSLVLQVWVPLEQREWLEQPALQVLLA